MGKLTCGCLNVQIQSINADSTPVDISQHGIDSSTADEFFLLDLGEIQLNIEGVQFEQSSLVKTRRSYDWVIHQCTNCQMLTHAAHVNQGKKLLVNSVLKRDPTTIESLTKSADYSPLYKIVLKNRNDIYSVKNLGVQSGKFESLQKTLSGLQQQLESFLSSEKSAMEERIRSYEKEQRDMYAELQSKAVRDKNAMISLVLAMAEEEVSKTLQEAMRDTSEQDVLAPLPSKRRLPIKASPARMDIRSVAFDNVGMQRIRSRKSPATSGLSSQKSVNSSLNRSHLEEQEIPKDVYNDSMFDFDPAFVEESNQPFYISDDDDDTDDSSFTDEGEMGMNPGRGIYSSSVPINMPAWNMNKPSYMAEDDDDAPAPDMSSMAASIKALAKSVHCDGTEMFGDLPPSRKVKEADMGNQ